MGLVAKSLARKGATDEQVRELESAVLSLLFPLSPQPLDQGALANGLACGYGEFLVLPLHQAHFNAQAWRVRATLGRKLAAAREEEPGEQEAAEALAARIGQAVPAVAAQIAR